MATLELCDVCGVHDQDIEVAMGHDSVNRCVECLLKEFNRLHHLESRLPKVRQWDGEWMWVAVVARQRVYFLGPAPEREVLWLDVEMMNRGDQGWSLHGHTQHEQRDWQFDSSCFYDRESARRAREEAGDG